MTRHKTTLAILAAAFLAAILAAFYLLLPANTGVSESPAQEAVPSGGRADSEEEAAGDQASAAAEEPASEGPDLADILTAEADNATIVKNVLAAAAKLPKNRQVEYITHATIICEDKDFGLLESALLGGVFPPEVNEVIFANALQRPPEIALPLLAKIADTPENPQSQDAREILGLQLGADPAEASTQSWKTRVESHLREQTGDGS